MLGQLLRQLEREGFEINGTWNSTLKFSSATQEQALRTNYHVDKMQNVPHKGESVTHIISECRKLAQKKDKKRHDNITRMIHWECEV